MKIPPLPKIDTDKLSTDIREALKGPGGTSAMRSALARGLQLIEAHKAAEERVTVYRQLVDMVGEVRTLADLRLEHVGRTIEIDVTTFEPTTVKLGMTTTTTSRRVVTTHTIEIGVIDADKHTVMFVDRKDLQAEKWSQEFVLTLPCRLLPVDTLPANKAEHLPTGLCGNREDHEPHRVDSAAVSGGGPMWCHADQTKRLPFVLENKKKEITQ